LFGAAAAVGNAAPHVPQKQAVQGSFKKIKDLRRPYSACPDLSTGLSSGGRDKWCAQRNDLHKKRAMCHDPL